MFLLTILPSLYFFKHYSICPFIVILHISCCRLRILETLPLILCSSPDSLGEILFIFQSAVVFTGFLSSLFMLCHHVPWLSHFSRGNTSEGDTFSRCPMWSVVNKSTHMWFGIWYNFGACVGFQNVCPSLQPHYIINICKQYANGKCCENVLKLMRPAHTAAALLIVCVYHRETRSHTALQMCFLGSAAYIGI